MPRGSRAFLIAWCTVMGSSPSSWLSPVALDLADAVLAGQRAAQLESGGEHFVGGGPAQIAAGTSARPPSMSKTDGCRTVTAQACNRTGAA
jgi:hypothetical protein